MKRILFDSHGDFIFAALVEGSRLVDLIVDKKDGKSITGNVYFGVVKNILPNQFAFIDIGYPKNGFLNIANNRRLRKLRVGQNILVQVRRDPTGDKGASLSCQIDITGRSVILVGNGEKTIGVSHKIKDRKERKRLKSLVRDHVPVGLGVILRTCSEKKGAKEVQRDLNELIEIHKHIVGKGIYQSPPALVYQENSLLHDYLGEHIDEVIVGEPSLQALATQEAERSLKGVPVRLYTDDTISLKSEVERQLNKALEKKIWLDCGGFLIIEQTEACVIIDVNTGRFIGHRNHKKSVLKVNLEAAAEAAAQIRLRNLSGMIIIDFINMESRDDTQKLYRYFSEVLSKDRIKTNIIGMTELGLMQLTRRKTRESLSHIIMKECPHCKGAGAIRL